MQSLATTESTACMPCSHLPSRLYLWHLQRDCASAGRVSEQGEPLAAWLMLLLKAYDESLDGRSSESAAPGQLGTAGGKASRPSLRLLQLHAIAFLEWRRTSDWVVHTTLASFVGQQPQICSFIRFRKPPTHITFRYVSTAPT